MDKKVIYFGNPDQMSPVIRHHIDTARRHGKSMLCLRQEDGSVELSVMSPAEFYAHVGSDMTDERRKLLETLLEQDFGSLEQRALALCLSGRRASMMVCDEWADREIQLREPEEEQSVQVGNRLVAPNKKTKGRAHALPFYLGKKRF